MPTNEQKVINSAEVRQLVEKGYDDWRDLVRVAVQAYENRFGAANSYIYPLPNSHASDAEMDAACEKVWKEFWEPIISSAHVEGSEAADISLSELDQIKSELYDAHMLMRNVSIIYSEVTGHQVSKPLTDPYVVAQLAQEQQQKYERENVWEFFDSISDSIIIQNRKSVTLDELEEWIGEHFGKRDSDG